jgi:flagellar basal body-associated protein FliL
MSQSETAHGSSGKKKTKGAASKVHAPEILWTVRLSLAIKNARESTIEVFRSLGSPDGPTRKMSVVFVASLLCVVATLVAAGERYLAIRRARSVSAATIRREESMLSSFLKKQADLAMRKNVMFPLGQFSLELRAPAGEPLRRGVMNLAEVEIVLECDTKETRFYFEDNLPQTRNQVTDVLVAMDRSELLSQDGKLRLKHRIIEKLNTMLPRGKVENLYFSKLILS